MLLFACLIFVLFLSRLPLFRGADTPPISAQHREIALDGLRGVLAYSVFVHHAVIYQQYIRTGAWEEPRTRFYEMLGPFGVSVFFMITGYLFFSHLLEVRGRPKWVKFYLNRVFRIGPLYVAAVLIMFCLVFWSKHMSLVEPAKRVLVEIGSWLSLGILPQMPIDGDRCPDRWLAGVTWTIRYEWFFYFSLIPLAYLARRPKVAGVVLTAVLAISLTRPEARAAVGNEQPRSMMVCLFLVGMLCALGKRLSSRVVPEPWGSILAICLVSAAFLAHAPYTWLPLVSLGAMFFLVCKGCPIFGLLTMKTTRRLGNVSYGIYLLQGLALAAVFGSMPLKLLARQSELNFDLCVLAAAAILLCFATVAHVSIERPFIARGHALSRRFMH